MHERKQSRLTLSWRVGVPHYETDEAFEALMEQVRANADWLDEVAFFDSITHHLYLPLELFEERARILAGRIAAMRQAGIRSVGINVLATLGHLDEARDTMPQLPFQPFTGMDGRTSTGCGCPNAPGLRAYVGRKYALMAGAGPDFIWVDDDVRMNNHGVPFGCFCPVCVGIFSNTTGHGFDRASLVAALHEADRDDLRAAWLAHNGSSISALMAHVAASIAAVNPSIATGLMTAGAGDLYSGADVSRWLLDLGASKLRPGGGFYCDATPGGMVSKAYDIGRGARAMRHMPEITDIQYELENFPYQKLRKSVTALLSECTLALATGCDGVALNMLPMWGAPYDECAAFLPALRRVRPAWEQLTAHAAGLPTAGLWAPWRADLLASVKPEPGRGWPGGLWEHGTSQPYVLAEIGLPLSVEPWDGEAPPRFGCVLTGRLAQAFDDDALRALLAGGVLMDTGALDVLTERGLSSLAGVRVERRIDNGAMERFTDDALNGSAAGQIRDARIEFWGDARGMGDTLEAVADGVRPLAEMQDYFRRPLGTCMTAYENDLGGRVVVMGYAPWMFLQSVTKRAQLLSAADWITRGKLPVRIDAAVPVIPFVRMSADRAVAAVVLLNAGLDPVEGVEVRVRLADAERTEAVEIAPWSTATLLFG
jgi:hypothetical protein